MKARLKLKEYLIKIERSQRWFAKVVGTTPNNLSLIMRGESTPSLKLAYIIEKKTGGRVTVYDWIEDHPV